MNGILNKRLKIVTGIGVDGDAVLEDRSIDSLLDVLYRRAERLVADQEIRDRLAPAFREFLLHIVRYFDDSGEMDEYVLANIMTALATSDNHGPAVHGVEDYSTFIRRLNPADPDTDTYFVIGRAGRLSDPGCPLEEMANHGWRSRVPKEQLHMFHAFRFARSKDTARDAPRIPVWDFERMIPQAVAADSALEEAFLDVVFSDGAWELYQRKIAA